MCPLPRLSRPLSALIQSSSRRRFSTSTHKIPAPPLCNSVGSFSIETPTITEIPEKSNRNQPVELQSRRARIQLLLCIGVTKWDSARLRPRGVAVALPPVAHNYELPGCYLSALPRPSRPLSARIQSSSRRRFSTSTQKISAPPLCNSVGFIFYRKPYYNRISEKK